MDEKLLEEIQKNERLELMQNKMDIWWMKKREEARKKGDEAYNKGLWDGLGFFSKWLYPYFKK